jgi:membrane-associated phospholipid phosphatase
VPNGLPVYGSNQYAAELNEVQRLGGLNSTTRTADQAEIALFWGYDRGDTFRPPAQWNQIAETIALSEGTSVLTNARLFAHLNLAQADAGIVAWQTKYTYNQLRPITAVRSADTDGNALTIADPNWQSFLPTPPFPDYISGHATFGAAAAAVLEAYFGRNYAFSATSQEMLGVARSFNSFAAAAAENGVSRVYAGVHIPSANRDGLTTGVRVADYVLANTLTV